MQDRTPYCLGKQRKAQRQVDKRQRMSTAWRQRNVSLGSPAYGQEWSTRLDTYSCIEDLFIYNFDVAAESHHGTRIRDAGKNVFYLIYAYCSYTRFGLIARTRDLQNSLQRASEGIQQSHSLLHLP